VSGITAAKCLLDEGIEPVVFEQTHTLGGIWKFDDALPEGGGPAYRSLRTNTSKQTMAFSDYPMPQELPDYPVRADVERYLIDYANHFGVPQHIRFGITVEQVTPAGNNRWRVRFSAQGTSREEEFDAVLVCSGVFRHPLMPELPGAESFTGTVMHSRAYAEPGQFAGRNVAVVGVGSSGTDIAVEVSHVARRVWLSSRKGAWFIPRYLRGRPRDSYNSRVAALVPRRLSLPLLKRRVLAEYRRGGILGSLRELGLPDPPFNPAIARFTSNADALERIAAGAIVPKPAIARLDGDSIVFADGTREQVDVLILATGYTVSFPFLDESIMRVTEDGLDLYRLIFHPDHPGLSFIGMFRVSGPALPVAEMQARYVARLLRDAVSLPPRAEMCAAIKARRERIRREGGSPFKVEFTAYLDELAEAIGVKPRLWRHPALLPYLLFGTPTPIQYRLDGPGRWSGAAEAIRAANRHTPGRDPQAIASAEAR
jgi:dimethylaniline monooxygenase (N-oxide forming)